MGHGVPVMLLALLLYNVSMVLFSWGRNLLKPFSFSVKFVIVVPRQNVFWISKLLIFIVCYNFYSASPQCSERTRRTERILRSWHCTVNEMDKVSSLTYQLDWESSVTSDFSKGGGGGHCVKHRILTRLSRRPSINGFKQEELSQCGSTFPKLTWRQLQNSY